MDRFTELRDVVGKSASAHDYLKRYAIEGRLRPDRRLIPRDLEEYFGISATPIRDALVRLAAEGFLNWEPNHGFFTKAFLLQEQCELYQVLTVAIPSCWGRSSETSPTMVREAAIAFLDRFAARADPDPDPEAWNDALEHLMVIASEATCNGVLTLISRNAAERTRLVRLLDLERPETRRLLAEHMSAAVRAQDRFESREAADQALASFQARLPDLIDKANLKALQSRFP